MADTTETMKNETPAEKAAEAKVEPTASGEANSATAPAESTNAAGGDKGEDKKPTENGAVESTADSDEARPKLFVGRLPLGTKDIHLKELFGTYGEVTHCDIVGKYGFVHMKNKEEADEAMKKLHNHALNGSNITVQMSTSTAKRIKKKPNRKNFDNKKNNNNANTSTNSNQAPNRRPNIKNGFQQKNKNTNGGNNNNTSINNTKSNINSNNANNRNKNGNANNNNNLGHNNRQNGMMNKMRGRKFPTHRMPPMMPQLAPMNQGYYPNNPPPMNPQPYYQQPMPQMPPVGGPRDLYYNSRPMDNGQYYRSNGQSPQPMYGGGGGGGMPPQVPPQQSYYSPQQQQQPYSNRVGPVGGMGKMNPMPTHQQSQPPMYGSPMGMGPMSASPAPSMNTGYGQMNPGYGSSPMMGSNGVNNFTTRNGYAQGRGYNTRFNNYIPNHDRPNKRAKLN